jgi:hypothetical protein
VWSFRILIGTPKFDPAEIKDSEIGTLFPGEEIGKDFT